MSNEKYDSGWLILDEGVEPDSQEIVSEWNEKHPDSMKEQEKVLAKFVEGKDYFKISYEPGFGGGGVFYAIIKDLDLAKKYSKWSPAVACELFELKEVYFKDLSSLLDEIYESEDDELTEFYNDLRYGSADDDYQFINDETIVAEKSSTGMKAIDEIVDAIKKEMIKKGLLK